MGTAGKNEGGQQERMREGSMRGNCRRGKHKKKVKRAEEENKR